MSQLLESISRRLVDLHGLSEELARAVVAEVVDAFDVTVEEFVTERHRELQGLGLDNASIYPRLLEEITSWRFRAPRLSERQLRRRIYG